MIDEWVGGLGPSLAQWEVMRLVSPLNEEVVGPLPFGPLFRFFLFLSNLSGKKKAIRLNPLPFFR